MKIASLLLALSLASSAAQALEARFANPRYKRTAPLDVCYSFARDCGQRAANAFCDLQGFMRASSFTTAPMSPTRVYLDGKQCDGSYCVGFTNIVCWTSAPQRGPGHGWPQRID